CDWPRGNDRSEGEPRYSNVCPTETTMQAESLASPHAQYELDGFFLSPQPVIPRAPVRRATKGMDALRSGEYETGVPPQPSYWNPGDDPGKLCKIEMPQVANRAIMELISHPALGALAAEVTGARWVQVWWVQLLVKPPGGPEGGSTNIGWHQDRHYWQIWEEGSELFTAWVALSDVTPAAGPLRFVRGAHPWGPPADDVYRQAHRPQRG